MVKICPDCGREYGAELRYCKEDGAELVVRSQEEPVITAAAPQASVAPLPAKKQIAEPLATPNLVTSRPDFTASRPAAFMAELPDPEALEGFAGNTGSPLRTVIPIVLAVIGLLGVGGFVLTRKQDTPKINKTTDSENTAKPVQKSMPSASPPPHVVPIKSQSQPTKTRPPEPSSPVSSLAGEKYPQTKERLLSGSEVASWSYSSVRYAINEIYARHGYAFQNPAIRKQFSTFPWYRADSSVSMEQVEKSRLSRVEFDNAKLLARRRKELEAQGVH